MLNSMIWSIDFSRNLILKLHNSLKLFQNVPQKNSQKVTNYYRVTKIPKLTEFGRRLKTILF